MKSLVTLPLIVVLVSSGLYSQNKSADELIVVGIYQEEVVGDLNAAAQLFQQVLSGFSDDRVACARALYHLGLVNEKQGNKAEGYYNQLLEKYSDIGDYPNFARNRLNKIRNRNTFTDPRDGHLYKWIKIGNQIWMAENLAFMPHVNPPRKQEYGIWVYDYEGDDVSEAKATENYQKYGCLYDWPTAMGLGPEYLMREWGGNPENHQGLCPPGWRMPSDQDWMELESFLGMPDSLLLVEGGNRAGKYELSYMSYDYPPIGFYLKSTQGWISGSNGTNSSGFNGLPAGYRYPTNRSAQVFDQMGEFTCLLSSSEYNEDWRGTMEYYAIGRYLVKRKPADFDRELWTSRIQGSSVRCIKNTAGSLPEDYSTAKKPVFYTPQRNQQELTERIRTSKESDSLLLSSKLFNSANWTKFGKDYHNTGFVNVNLAKEKPQHVIKYLDGTNVFSASVVNDTIYCRGNDSTLYALDLNNGNIIWEYKAETTIKTDPAVTHNLILFAGSDGSRRDSTKKYGTRYVYAINKKSGHLVWRCEKGYEPSWNPAVVGDTLYIGINNAFSARDIYTGKEIWNYVIQENSRPAVHSGISIYKDLAIFGTYSTIRAMNLNTRMLEWEYNTQKPIFSSPAISKGIVLVGGSDHYFFALDAKSGEELWKFYTSGGSNWSSPGVDGAKVYFADSDGYYYALNIETGECAWKFQKDGERWMNTHPAITPSQLLIGSKDRSLFLLNSETGDIIWEYKIDKGSFTNPIIYGDIIIASSSNGLYILMNK